MALNLLTFFVGLFLLILVSIIIMNYKKDKKLNIFFLVLLAIAGIQRFVYGLEVFGIISFDTNPLQTNQLFVYAIPVVFYLFFDNLLLKKTPLQKVITHFITPFVIILVFGVFIQNRFMAHIVFLVFSTIYVILLIRLLWKYLSNKKNYRELVHFHSIKIWSMIMFSVFILMYLTVNYIFFMRLKDAEFNVLGEFYTFSSILWLLIIMYVLKNPVILYGKQLLLENLNKENIDEIDIWRKSKKSQTEIEDLDVEKKVKENVDAIIFSIKKLEAELLQDMNEIPNLKEFAFRIDYPQSHLKYVFKYYTYCTFGEYQNILKIKYGVKLIKSGYLDTRTIDSMSNKCLFTNRSTFFKNFKKLTGYSPTDYHMTLSNNS